jgi:hypothetical protein
MAGSIQCFLRRANVPACGVFVSTAGSGSGLWLVAWAIGAWVYTDISFEKQASAAFSEMLNICLNRQTDLGRSNVIRDCGSEAREARSLEVLHKNESAAFNALVPIPIAWLLVYIVVWTVRWVRRGFQPAG